MSTLPRPRQVTFAAGLIIGGSVLLVLSVFDDLAGMRSLETRESVQRFLAEPPGKGLGLDVEDVLGILRVLAMVAASCAAAMAVLGIHALKRSRSARVALSVLAVPLAISGLVAGGLFAPLVTVAVVMLWLQPSRDWFNGIEQRPAAPAPSPDREVPAAWQAPPAPPAAPPSTEPRPYSGFGTVQQPYGAPPADPRASYGPVAPGPAPRRPAAVVWACTLTWALSGLVAAGMVLSAIVIAVSPDLVMDELRKQEPSLADDITEDVLVGTVIAMAAVLVVWCTAAIVIAWFAFRRAPWAHVSLLVSAAVAGLFCLLGSLTGSFPLMVPLVGCAVAFALLLRPDVRAWFAARGTI